jgi:hippurate hydrolase
VYWFFGGDDPVVYAKAKNEGKLSSLPTNHNPAFAPVIHPTLETVKALVVGAHAWLVS